MNNIAPLRKEIEPIYQFMLLLLYAAGGVFIFTLLAFAVIIPVYGMKVLGLMMNGQIVAQTLGAFKILQLFSSVGLFLAPPVFLALTERTKLKNFFGFKTPSLKLLGMVFLIMIVSMPFMEWTVALNQKMSFPDGLKWLENWMRQKEDEAEKMTVIFLTVKNGWDIFLNFFIIALIPGIAEELMFRGAVQRSFGRIFANPHVAIWASAILFSAIHLQFFGFLPRMLLGAAFGYIYFWTGSLWYAMFAHFLNNAYAVGVAWYMQVHNISLENSDKTIDTPWYGYLISAILTAGMLIILKKATQQKDGEQLG